MRHGGEAVEGRGLLRRLGLDVHPGEGSTTALLFAGFFLVITFQYVVKTVRQATFIDELGAANLPWVYLLVALCSYPLLQIYVRLADRLPRHTLIAGSCILVAASLVGFWGLYAFDFGWVPVAFYVWVSIAFAVTVSQFWSFAAHVYDARQARRLFGIVGAGGLLGGIAGGQVARLVGQAFGTRAALPVAAVLLIAVAAVILAVERLQSAAARDDRSGATGMAQAEEARGGFGLIFGRDGNRHVQLVALVVVISVMVAQVIDLQFNWAVEQSTTGLGDRTAFYGNIFSTISVAAFVFQLLFTATILRSFGVGFAMRVLPVVLGLGTIALLVASASPPEIVVAAALTLKVGESGVRYSLDQSTRELLFLPVPAAIRIQAKAFIDVFLHRVAKGLAALLLLPVTFGVIAVPQAGWLTLFLIAAWLVVVAAVYDAYVGSFRSGLKDRSMDTSVPINLDDVKTVELLVQSLGSADTRQVLHSLELLDANDRRNLVPPLLLYHDDPRVRQRTLQILAHEGRTDAAPLVERRLHDESPEVRAEAVRVLSGFHTGDIADLMLPWLSEPDPRVKAAAVAYLIDRGDEANRNLAGDRLCEMLADARPEFRAEAVKAIGAAPGAQFESRLIDALYDCNADVARAAVHVVRRIVERDGFNPLFAPRLISLLENRRLKADAREALVAFGESAIPILVHFMNDPGESILVRRALPKTLAQIDTPATVEALVETLSLADDALLRARVTEALSHCDDARLRRAHRPKIEQAIRAETTRYLERLIDLAALGREVPWQFKAPLLRWDTRELSLLTQMIAERVEEHVKTLFGLLALLHPARDVWAAHSSLIGGGREARAHALEYLDNTLSGDVRRHVFVVIDDVPLSDKLALASKQYRLTPVSAEGAVARFLGGDANGEADGPALTVAALYTVYTERIANLYPRVRSLLDATRNPLVRETAEWVAGRIAGEAPRGAAP